MLNMNDSTIVYIKIESCEHGTKSGFCRVSGIYFDCVYVAISCSRIENLKYFENMQQNLKTCYVELFLDKAFTTCRVASISINKDKKTVLLDLNVGHVKWGQD